MPKTSIKTFLILIHELNYEMFFLSEKGEEVIKNMNEIDFYSVTSIVQEENLETRFEEMGEQFREMNRMRITLIGGLQRKVIEEMNSVTLGSSNKCTNRRTRSI